MLGALVVIARVEVPLPVTGGALQLLSKGSPEQVKLTIPANPFTAETVNVAVPELPGLAIVTVVVPLEKLKSGVLETVTVIAAEVEAL